MEAPRAAHDVLWPVRLPFGPRFFARVELQIQLSAVIRIGAEHLHLPDALVIFGLFRDLLAERPVPQVRVEFAIAQMIRLLEKHTHPGERANHVPQRGGEARIIK